MRLRLVLAVLLCWLCGSGLGAAQAVAPPAARLVCTAAGRAAERNGALPDHLLQSIGLVESGRIDPATGGAAAWPWTVNVDGAGHYFDSEPAAAAFARLAESAGARDVDVGCFQISLQQHPGAFTSLDSAFDPAGNAAFAAVFLNRLKLQTGSWDAAIADYHSAVPALGFPYRRRVLAAWQRFGAAPADSFAGLFAPDAGVILAGPAASLVRVITPDGETGPPLRGWLPQVITP